MNNNIPINLIFLLLSFLSFSNSCTSKNVTLSNKKVVQSTPSTSKNDSIIYSKSYRDDILTVLLYKKN